MITQMGLALIIIWLGNFIWMFYQIVRHTPDWHKKDVTTEDIVTNFITNITPEQLAGFNNVARFNPIMGMSGIALLLMGMMI